jgi:hypothetical protein
VYLLIKFIYFYHFNVLCSRTDKAYTNNYNRARSDRALVDFWSCPRIDSLKLNFDILFAFAHKFSFLNVNAGEASTALLAVETTVNLSSSSQILLEGDSLVTILALNNPYLSVEWSLAAIITDIISLFHSFLPSSFATKVSKSVNLWTHSN